MPRVRPVAKPISLNEEQRVVVGTSDGSWQCLAGPGSGKSACLCARFTRLIQEGVDPNSAISLSFTKTAAKNLRDRVEAQTGTLSINRTAGCLTFHSVALSFAQEERSEFNFELAEFPLADEVVANRLAGEAARRLEVDPRKLREFASLQKRRRIRPESAIKSAELSGKPAEIKLALAYKGYQKKLVESGVLDFDSCIMEMVEILDRKPAVRARWTYDYLQIDEAQDCAKIEWDLAKLISGKSVLAVGDISQGLYSFRGGDSRLFAEMDQIFPGTKTLYLSCNYRSTPEIIDFIRPHAQSKGLAEKFHTPNSSGPVPRVIGFNSSIDEATWVVNQIRGVP